MPGLSRVPLPLLTGVLAVDDVIAALITGHPHNLFVSADCYFIVNAQADHPLLVGAVVD